MSQIAVGLFIAASLIQRLVEMLRHDRNLWKRQPHWTAPALSCVLVGFSIGSAIEHWLEGRALNLAVSAVGGVLFAVSFAIRRWVLKSLGNFWAIDIDIKQDHQLRTEGPYRYCRHPNYLAMLLELIGTCLIANAYVTLLVSLPIYALLLAARVRTEERSLVETFGEQYRAYKSRTFAIVPIRRRTAD